MPPVLEVSALELAVAKRVLVRGLSFAVDRAGSLAIMGRSGVGKTTLLRSILGLHKPRAGSIRVGEVEVTTAKQAALAKLRLHTAGMVFQDARLLPGLTALQNAAIPALIAKVPREEAVARARDLLSSFEVPPDTLAEVLSGGEAQRAGLARALMNSPELLLADEPTGSLDAELKDQIADELFALPHTQQCALVVVTHDPDIAGRADHIVHIAAHTDPPS